MTTLARVYRIQREHEGKASDPLHRLAMRLPAPESFDLPPSGAQTSTRTSTNISENGEQEEGMSLPLTHLLDGCQDSRDAERGGFLIQRLDEIFREADPWYRSRSS